MFLKSPQYLHGFMFIILGDQCLCGENACYRCLLLISWFYLTCTDLHTGTAVLSGQPDKSGQPIFLCVFKLGFQLSVLFTNYKEENKCYSADYQSSGRSNLPPVSRFELYGFNFYCRLNKLSGL